MNTKNRWIITVVLLIGVGGAVFYAFQSKYSEIPGASVDQLDEKMELFQQEIDGYKKEIAQYQEAIEQYQIRIDQYQSEMIRLNDQIKMYAVDRNQMRGELDSSYARVSELINTVQKLEEDIVSVQEWESDVLIPKVMTVNRPYKFVVINQGLKDQIKIGDQFGVERSGRSIALLEVERLYPSFSSAIIVSESEEAKILPGDFIQPANP